MSEFSKRLSETMKGAGVTQSALAKQLNIAQQSISYWVKGTYEPSLSQILELCRALDITPNYLLGFSEF